MEGYANFINLYNASTIRLELKFQGFLQTNMKIQITYINQDRNPIILNKKGTLLAHKTFKFRGRAGFRHSWIGPPEK